MSTESVAAPHEPVRSTAVQEARLRREVTQVELAAGAGVSRQTVIKAERGEGISRLKAQKIARALGFEWSDLFVLHPSGLAVPIVEPQEASA